LIVGYLLRKVLLIHYSNASIKTKSIVMYSKLLVGVEMWRGSGRVEERGESMRCD